MTIEVCRVSVLIVLAAFAIPALADDCTAAKSAMLDTGHRPLSTTTTKTDALGKQSVTRTVQTVTNKYVQTADGKWYSMGIAIKDLTDNTNMIKACQRSGSDTVNGEAAAVYGVHMGNEGTVIEYKFWVSSKNLILKSEYNVGGARISTVYDFSHVRPPADAIPMGGK